MCIDVQAEETAQHLEQREAEMEKITDFLKCPLISIIGNILYVCSSILFQSCIVFQAIKSSTSYHCHHCHRFIC